MFPPWMGSYPYRSSSGPITIEYEYVPYSRPNIRRRSPHSAFGIRSELRSSPKPNKKSSPPTPLTTVTRFFRREYKFITRGPITSSITLAFLVGPVAVFGSVALLFALKDHRDRQRFDRQRAIEEKGEDWGDGFQ
ncbi:hypothetical protein VTL71DRAFT_10359 [Oculimacula yallundae]|uniref:Transmembrane protein n=1 Tax=Oculimacula yallundae TaxID=86028 RepID=A0ABR4CSV4_9HELO